MVSYDKSRRAPRTTTEYTRRLSLLRALRGSTQKLYAKGQNYNMRGIKFLLRRPHMAAFLLLALLGNVGPPAAHLAGSDDPNGCQATLAQSRVLGQKQLLEKPVEIALDYVRSARVIETTVFDFPNKTLIIEFRGPMRVTSTLEGERRGILTVGNHYIPPPCWGILHRLSL
jgi:hypothetical protein